MAKFTKINTPDRLLNQIQDNIGQIVNPLTAIPLNSGNLLQNVMLISGTTAVNHKLGRALIGWFITRQRGAAAVYDVQDSNSTPTLTLDLVSSAQVVVDLFVF